MVTFAAWQPENYQTNSSKCCRIKPFCKNRLSLSSGSSALQTTNTSLTSWCGRRTISIAAESGGDNHILVEQFKSLRFKEFKRDSHGQRSGV